MASEKVTLYNTENDTLIEVVLSIEDARRVEKDLSFATKIMNAATRDEQLQSIRDTQETETEMKEEEVQILTDTQETETQVTDDGEEGSVYRWTSSFVLLLLETYKDIETKLVSGKQSQKKVWEEVSAVLAKINCRVTGPQCAAKLRSLKKSYKSVKDHNSKSGNDRRTWLFYKIMDSIFSKKAWAAPSALASSSGLTTRAEIRSSPSTNTNDELPITTTPSSSASKINVLLAKRMRQKEEHEEARAKRHKERMEMDEKLLKMLEKIT